MFGPAAAWRHARNVGTAALACVAVLLAVTVAAEAAAGGVTATTVWLAVGFAAGAAAWWLFAYLMVRVASRRRSRR